MKKILACILAAALLCPQLCLFSAAASAPYYTDKAVLLQSFGLFQGTDKGFELTEKTTRVQAVVQLCRLLGKEKEALSGRYSHPFTDVPAWASGYVAYAYRFNLTKGLSEREFGANTLCDARMFVTLLLRTIGYSDSGASPDFSYTSAIRFAGEAGLISDNYVFHLYEQPFLRDDMVMLSYQGLLHPHYIAGSYHCLLQDLVADGIVDEGLAEPYLNIFLFDRWFSSHDTEITSAAQTENGKSNAEGYSYTIEGRSENGYGSLQLLLNEMLYNTADYNEAEKRMDYTESSLSETQLSFNGEVLETSASMLKDGYYYFLREEGGGAPTKIKVNKAKLMTYLNQYSDLLQVEGYLDSVLPDKPDSGQGADRTMLYVYELSSMLEGLLNLNSNSAAPMADNRLPIEMTFSEEGQLTVSYIYPQAAMDTLTPLLTKLAKVMLYAYMDLGADIAYTMEDITLKDVRITQSAIFAEEGPGLEIIVAVEKTICFDGQEIASKFSVRLQNNAPGQPREIAFPSTDGFKEATPEEYWLG